MGGPSGSKYDTLKPLWRALAVLGFTVTAVWLGVGLGLTPPAGAQVATAPPRVSSFPHGSSAPSAPAQGDPDAGEVGPPAAPPAPAPAPAPPPEPAEPEAPALDPSAAAAPSMGPPAPAAPASVPVPLPSASAAPETAPANVTLKGTQVFSLRVNRAGKPPSVRAAAATKVLDAGFDSAKPSDIRTETKPEGVILYLGAEPIILVTDADAEAAGEENLEVYAAGIAERTRQVLEQEKRRSRIATTVFSFSLVVFFGLIALYLLRKTGEFLQRAKSWLEANPERIPAIKLQDIEIVKPALLRNALDVALSLIRRLGQLGIIYTWLVVALSLFDSTRGYTEKLTGFVLTPLSALMARVATSLPLLLVAITAVLAVALMVRFTGLFFESVERGESEVDWLQPDLARPTSILVRFGIVLSTLVFAAPVITGDPEGALAKAGAVAVAALSLSAVPLLSSAVAGAITVFGRRLRVGEYVDSNGIQGRIVQITLLDLEIEDETAVRVRIPHLLGLIRPLRVLGPRPRVAVEVAIAAGSSREEAASVLESACVRIGSHARVELLDFDSTGLRFRVSVSVRAPEDSHRLRCELADALEKAGIALGGRRL